MIIDTHAHITGPMEMYELFRGYTNVSGPAGRALTRYKIEARSFHRPPFVMQD